MKIVLTSNEILYLRGLDFGPLPQVIIVTIIPSADGDKKDYFDRVIPYLDTNKVRLSVDATKIGDLVSALPGYDSIYDKAKNKNLSTKSIRDEKNAIQKLFSKDLREIYDDIPRSALTIQDRNTLSLYEPEAASERPVIADVPAVIVKAEKGSVEKLEFRKDADSSRASMHPDADAIEVRWAVDKVVNSIEDCDKVLVKKSATIRLKMPHEKAGKRFAGYARWVNLSDETKSGEFTPLFGGLIGE